MSDPMDGRLASGSLSEQTLSQTSAHLASSVVNIEPAVHQKIPRRHLPHLTFAELRLPDAEVLVAEAV